MGFFWSINKEKNPCNNKDELKARITAVFNNSNKETVGTAYKRFRIYLDSIINQWWFIWVNLIHNILRYILLILVNRSDKLRCQCYFHFLVIYTTIYSSQLLFSWNYHISRTKQIYFYFLFLVQFMNTHTCKLV